MTNPTELPPAPISGGKSHNGCFPTEQPELTDAEFEQVLQTLRTSRLQGKLLQPDDIKRLVAVLAESRPLRVLDAGDLFSQAELRVLHREYSDSWKRVHFTWASSPFQVLDALEDSHNISPTLIVLDLLRPFLDVSLPFERRRRLLRVCLLQLEQLHRYSYVIVSLGLPETPDAGTKELLRMLANATLKTHFPLVFHAASK